MAKTSYNIQEWAKAGFEDYLLESGIDAPFTEIDNRAKVQANLVVSNATERIMINGIKELDDESTNGGPVHAISSLDSRIRVVGRGWVQRTDTNSTFIDNSTSGDYIEVIFYGTGLNLVAFMSSSGRDIRATIDNNAEGPNLWISDAGVTNSRNYKSNKIVSVAKDLSLGWHRAKLTNYGSNFSLYGFEILNASEQMSVISGSGFSGMIKQTLNSGILTDYKPSGMGVNGGRVVKYLKDGLVQEAYTENSALYLTNTDHSNEDVVRRINWLEFGTDRSDDFTSLSTSNTAKAFVLDDGTTTLHGNNIRTSNGLDGKSHLTVAGAGFDHRLTFIFVGTGLSISQKAVTGSTFNEWDVYIDSVDRGRIQASGEDRIIDICSGLPYGTHIVSFVQDTGLGSGNAMLVDDFIIYQPKKPSIPSDALELYDYNIMADVVPNTTIAHGTVTQGMIYKNISREITHVGNWGTANLTSDDDLTRGGGTFGWSTNNSTNAAYMEYTFLGTGFEYRCYCSGDGASSDVTINGLAATSANFPTGVANDFGSVFNFSTGAHNEDTNNGSGAVDTGPGQAGFSITNLPLGIYTVRVTNTEGGGDGVQRFHAFAYAAPIHINEPTLKVGNKSLKANENTKPNPKEDIKTSIGNAKAWVVFDAVDNRVLSSHNISHVLDVSTGLFEFYFDKAFKNENYAVAGLHDIGGIVDPVNQGAGTGPDRGFLPYRFRCNFTDQSSTQQNPRRAVLVFYGELIDEE